MTTIMSITVTVMMMEMMLRMTHGSGLPAGVCRIIHSLLPLTLATPVRHIVYTNWCIAVPTSIHLYQPIAKQSKALPTITKKKIAVPTSIPLYQPLPRSCINHEQVVYIWINHYHRRYVVIFTKMYLRQPSTVSLCQNELYSSKVNSVMRHPIVP